MEVVKTVYKSSSKSKATSVREMAKYWYINNTLPISRQGKHQKISRIIDDEDITERCHTWICANRSQIQDRKSTRLNSSHGSISYAVFCLKKKKKKNKKRNK